MSTTTTYLSKVIPGQTPDWYKRIAVLIDNGMMPMPESSTIEAPMVATSRRTSTQERPSPQPSQPSYRPPQVQSVPRASASTEAQLMERLNGDRKAAERIVSHLAALNPLKSGEWCWEKALWDLDRDRH